MGGPCLVVAVEQLVMRVLHLEHRAVARLLHRAGAGDPVSPVQLLRDKRLVEPHDLQAAARIVAERCLCQPDPPAKRLLRADRRDGADDGRLPARGESGYLGRGAVRLPIEREREQQVANRLDAKLRETFDIRRLDLGQRRYRSVERPRKDNYAHRVISTTSNPPPSIAEPQRGSGLSSGRRRTIIAIVIIAIVVIGIIGYAFAGYAYTAARIANADKSLNTVVSHQNRLNTTFKEIDTKVSGLNSSSATDLKQTRT